MYVYVSNEWNIILRSNKKLTWLQNKYREYDTKYSITDNLIYEDNQIKRYENSRQYAEDKNKFHLERELEETKRKNNELTKIANTKVTKELELDKRGLEANEYQRKLYLLKNMRWLQQS